MAFAKPVNWAGRTSRRHCQEGNGPAGGRDGDLIFPNICERLYFLQQDSCFTRSSKFDNCWNSFSSTKAYDEHTSEPHGDLGTAGLRGAEGTGTQQTRDPDTRAATGQWESRREPEGHPPPENGVRRSGGWRCDVSGDLLGGFPAPAASRAHAPAPTAKRTTTASVGPTNVDDPF